MIDTISIVEMVFGCISLLMSIFVSAPQLILTITSKNTSGTSLISFCIFALCSAVSLSWGFVYYFANIGDWIIQIGPDKSFLFPVWQWTVIPVVLTYTYDFITGVIMVFIKANHVVLSKKMKITELQLSRYLLNAQQKKLMGKQPHVWNNKYFPLFPIYAGTILLTLFVALMLTFLTNPYVVHHAIPFIDGVKYKPLIISLSMIGAATWEAMSWPQFIRCIKYKDTSGMSLTWAIFLPITCVVSFTYCLILAIGSGTFEPDTIGALIFNGIIVNVGVLIIKIKNIKKAKALHISELEYTKKYLEKKEKNAPVI